MKTKDLLIKDYINAQAALDVMHQNVIQMHTAVEKAFQKYGMLLSMAAVEKFHIETVLNYCNGNREHASKILKMSERTLYRRIRKYGLNIK